MGTGVEECHTVSVLRCPDETGTPLGIISSRDFLQYVVKELELFIDKALAQHKFEAGVDAYEHFSGPFVGYRIVSDARRK